MVNSKLSKEQELEKSIADLQAAYHEGVTNEILSRAQQAEMGEKLRDARTALSTHLAEGAKPCPDCKVAAMGMLKARTPEVEIYEVGCPDCTLRSRGGSPERAVEKWNAGDYIPPKTAE